MAAILLSPAGGANKNTAGIEKESKMYKEWTSEDILKRRHYADLGEYGEFTADTRKPLEIISTWQVVVKGTYTYGEKQQEKELFIELDDALTEEEIESLSAGEIFIRGWKDFTF